MSRDPRKDRARKRRLRRRNEAWDARRPPPPTSFELLCSVMGELVQAMGGRLTY